MFIVQFFADRALSFGLRGVESRRQDCRQRIPPSAKPPICLSLQIDSTLFKDLPPEYQLQFKSNSNFWRMKSFWIFTYLTEATIETQCCAKGKLSPSLQNRGSTKTDMVKLRSSCSTPTDQIPWYLPPSSLIFPFPSDWQTTSKVVLIPAWVNFFTSKETVNAFNNIISQKW